MKNNDKLRKKKNTYWKLGKERKEGQLVKNNEA